MNILRPRKRQSIPGLVTYQSTLHRCSRKPPLNPVCSRKPQTPCEANRLDLCKAYKGSIAEGIRVSKMKDKKIQKKDRWNGAWMKREQDGLSLHEREVVMDG